MSAGDSAERDHERGWRTAKQRLAGDRTTPAKVQGLSAMGGGKAVLRVLLMQPGTAAALVLLLFRSVEGSRWKAIDANCTSYPRVIRATNKTLTVVADFLFLPSCQNPHLVWQAKSWVEDSWQRDADTADDSPYTFTDLVPGIRYDVRALPYSEGKPCSDCDAAVVRAHTCSDEIPAPEDLYFTKREEGYLDFQWRVPEQTCASIHFLIQMDEPFDEDKSMEECPPPFLASPQPNYTCHEENAEKICSARIEGIKPDGKYYVGVIGVDSSGNCSYVDFNVSDPEARAVWPVGVGPSILLAVTLLGIFAATPLLFKKFRKRLRESAREGPRITFSREKPSVGRVSNVDIENDDDIGSQTQTRTAVFLTVPIQT